jgi:hypothetical protein
MLRLAKFGTTNPEIIYLREDAVESFESVSSGPQPFTVVVMDSGNVNRVSETPEEIEIALQTWKESSQAKP